MTRTITVASHKRRIADKAPDPLAAQIDANRPRFQSKWGSIVVIANDEQPKAQPEDRPEDRNRWTPWFWRRR
jgi:hypothetical protein